MKQIFALLVALFLAAVLIAATAAPVYITAGAIRCGCMRRSDTEVQIWCWTGIVYSASTALSNSLFKIAPEKMTTDTYNYGPDTVKWVFMSWPDKSVTYEATANSGSPITGSL